MTIKEMLVKASEIADKKLPDNPIEQLEIYLGFMQYRVYQLTDYIFRNCEAKPIEIYDIKLKYDDTHECMVDKPICNKCIECPIYNNKVKENLKEERYVNANSIS